MFEGRHQNDETDAMAFNPKILLKVISFVYSRGMLSCGYRPDHSTNAHLVSSMQKEIKSPSSNMLLVCAELNLLGGTHFNLDGVKLPSNVSKKWSGTFKELENKLDKLQANLQQTLGEHIRTDGLPANELEQRHKQERRFQHQVERLNHFLQEEQPKIGKKGKEIQSNVTDNRSAKMTSSHGVIQGYNAQALVDAKHQVIVQAEAFSTQDHENLASVIAGAKKNMQSMGKDENYFRGRQLSADSNYHSYNNLSLCKAEGLDAYIPDIQFRKRDERFAQQHRFKDGIHPRKRQASKTAKFTAADFSFDA